MELHNVDLGGDALNRINEDKTITLEELKELNGLRLKELAAFSAKERTVSVPVKPADDASEDAKKTYEMNKNAYDEKIAKLDKFDNGISKLKESYEKSKAELFEKSRDELAKLEAEIGIPKSAEAGKPEGGTTTPGVTPAAKPEVSAVAGKDAEKPAAPERKEEPKQAEYVVKKGDNLTKIAKAHGTTVEALAKENGITNVNKIREGQKLKVPAKAEAPKVEDGAAAKAAEAKPATKDKPAEAGKPETAKGDKPKTAAAKPESPADKPTTEAKSTPKPGEAQPTSAAATPETAKAPDRKPGGISYQEVAGAKLKTPTAGGDSQKA